MTGRWILAILACSSVCSTALAETFTVTLKAVDAEKMPAAKVDVALYWSVKGGAMTASAEKAVSTDANGKAVLSVDDWQEKRPVLMLSADRKLGGIVSVSKEDDGKELTVTLLPTVRIKARLECKELNSRPSWVNTMVSVEGVRAPFAQNDTKDAAFAFVLPAGKYTLKTYGLDVQSIKQSVTLTADRPEHDLGTLDMKASPIAKMKGKQAADWVISDARGAKADVKLSDYKGKWVYVEFWGFW